MKTKKELLTDLSKVMNNYFEVLKQDGEHSEIFIQELHKAYDEYFAKIESSSLIEPLPDGWKYEWGFNLYRFEVGVIHQGDRQEYILISVPVSMLTPEEYANSRGVKVTTVLKWLIRAKLKAAYKVGRTWRISALMELPTERGYTYAAYKIVRTLKDVPEDFSYLNDCETITLKKSSGNVGMHEVHIYRKSTVEPRILNLNNEERDKLELYLIESYDVEYMQNGFENMYFQALSSMIR